MSTPGLPVLVENGVPVPQSNRVLLHPTQSPQKLAKMLDKAARHVGDAKKLDKGGKNSSSKGSAKGKSKSRVTKATGRAIVGSKYSAGGKK